MKRVLSLFLCLSILMTTALSSAENGTQLTTSPKLEQDVHFTGMSDQYLPAYIEDTVYGQLIKDLDSDEYLIEDVTAIYISQEYLEEVAYNSQTNVFFGYSLADLDAYFEGTRYVFTVNEAGETVVEPLQVVKDTTYDQILKNVAIGTGVILVCVTVSVATAGTGAAAVSMIFAVAAKTAASCALSGTLISGITAAAIRGYQTGDFGEALKAGALGASEGYKWGAISGAVTGAASETSFLYKWHKATKISWNDAARIQREAKFSTEFIRTVHSYEEYSVYKDAHLIEYHVGDKRILLPDGFDFDFVDPRTGFTNRELMSKGLNPVDINGVKYEWHHVGQQPDSPLALLTNGQHHGNDKILHPNQTESVVRPGGDDSAWEAEKKVVNALAAALLHY